VIGKAATIMLEEKEKFARLATLEMGKRIAESLPGPANHQVIGRRCAPGILSAGRSRRRTTVELPLLSARALCRSASHVGQRRHIETPELCTERASRAVVPFGW
jgi:hypothetical protein